MANRNFVGSQALMKNLKLLSGSFKHDGAGKLGQGYSVARTAVGKYTITLEDTYPSLTSAILNLQLASGDDKYVQWGSIDVASAKTASFVIRDKSSSNAYETTEVVCVADTGVMEETEVTFPAVAAATQADYFMFYSQDGVSYAIWLDIDENGTEPTGALYTGADVQIMVPVATGDTAAQVATKAKTAIGTQITNVSVVDDLAGKLTFTQDVMGVTTDALPKNADDSGAGSITVSITAQGVNSNLNNSYFTISSADDLINYYVWFNVNGEGVDPAIANKTGVEVAIAASAADTAVASALETALDALDAFGAAAVGATVTVTNAAYGVTTDAADGTAATGFTITVTQQGDSIEKDIADNANNRINFQLWLNNGSVD